MVKGRTESKEESQRRLDPAKTPNWRSRRRRGVERPAVNETLMERILNRENLQKAWRRVKANKGAPGVDGMTLEEFPAFVREHWASIRESLREGTYRPQPVRRKEIPKPDGGGTRLLGIPAVVDRVIQQAISQVLTPIFDPHFSDRSYGFRPGKSAHQAVKQVRRYVKAGYRIAVGLDLYRFFDEVNHDVLMSRVSKRAKDKTLLKLIGRILRAGVAEGDQIQPTSKGVPQGGPLSPLLANIVLDDLDKELERRGHRYCRYADDGVILVRSRRAGERVKQSVTRYLRRRLKLSVNEKKSRVAPMGECGFLGFTIQRGKIRWTDKAEAAFKRRIKALTGRSWGVSMGRRLAELAEYERGWMNYFRLSEHYRIIPELDHWVRRRVRMCYWKQWRYARTRIRNLVALGTARRTAIQTAMSRKGYWRLSKTLAAQTGLTNGWLAEQGLLSLKEMWVSFHYPETSTARSASSASG